MSIHGNLDKLDQMIDNATEIPLTRGKILVDAEVLMEISDNIRMELPNEIQQACVIVKDRNRIIEEAKKKAEEIIHNAKNRVKMMVEREEILKEAKRKSNEIKTETEAKAREIKRATYVYIDDVLKKTEETIMKDVGDIKKIRQNISKNIKK